MALDSGKRVSNTYGIFPKIKHSFVKTEVIFDVVF